MHLDDLEHYIHDIWKTVLDVNIRYRQESNLVLLNYSYAAGPNELPWQAAMDGLLWL